MQQRWQHIIAIFVNAMSVTVVQILAILNLAPLEYGRFSLGYILYAAGVSAVHAIVCDTWSRSAQYQEVSAWRDYAAALVALALTLTLPMGAVLAILQFGLAGIWISVAIFTNLCRIGARYHAVAHDEHRYVTPADALALITTLGAFFIAMQVCNPFDSIAISWAAGGIVSLLASKKMLPRRHALRSWLRNNAASIKTLGTDAVLVDATALGVPLLISPLLGAANFGVYRSMSSTAIPVRLAINPIRPKIMSSPPRYFFHRLRLILIVGFALVLGAIVYLGLRIVSLQELFTGGILAALAAFAIPAGIFVAANFISTLFYISNRSHLPGRVLLTVGITQLMIAASLPIGAYMIGGLAMLMYAFALASMFNASINALVAFRHAS